MSKKSNWTMADVNHLIARGVRVTFTGGKDEQPAQQAAPTAKQQYQALGRQRGMNKTERHYAELLEAQRIAGVIAWYGYELIKFKIAEKCWFTPDFIVMTTEGELQAHEVKAQVITDDSLVKIKACADKFPFQFFIKRLVKGNWETRTFK